MENTLNVEVEKRDMKKATAMYVKYAENLKKKQENKQSKNK